VRKIYDSYPFKNADNWIVSWKALRQLVDDDHGALFQAKEFYLEKSRSIPSTTSIDEHLREVLSKEFENMKSIEKYGRSNGLCPYTPYEDIPKTSRSLSEKLQRMNEPKSNGSRHPYDDLVYLYNDVVNDFNKFTELAKHNLLKTIHQPDWIDISAEAHATGGAHPVQAVIPLVPEKKVSNVSVVNPDVQSQGKTVLHDTVYIEKRDTIYLADPGEDLRSMEGYAINNMVLLLDVSGSMNAPEKLPLLKSSVLNLLSMMRKEDQVSIVIYSGKAKVLLQPTSFKDENKITSAINELTSSGKTDGNAGIKLAYQVADKNYLRGGDNRIILATDGEFPISEDVFAMADKFSKEDIFLSVFNFGKTTSSAKNLEKLSSKGKGNYEHISKENMELKLIREAKSKKSK
jgi:Mg-chelatase subunit ChlD